MTRKITLTHNEYKVMLAISNRDWQTDKMISIESRMSITKCQSALKRLKSLGIATPKDALIEHRRPWELTDIGAAALRLIDPWHGKSWWVRRKNRPAPTVNLP